MISHMLKALEYVRSCRVLAENAGLRFDFYQLNQAENHIAAVLVGNDPRMFPGEWIPEDFEILFRIYETTEIEIAMARLEIQGNKA